MNRRSFLSALLAASLSTQVKAEDIQALCEKAQQIVNSKLTYATDMEVFGLSQVVENVKQAYKRGKGDCEEFAICYRHELIQLGVSPSRIKIVYCYVEFVGAHAICVVDNTLVIDCYLPNSVRPLSRRPDLIPSPKVGKFLAYTGETEAQIVESIKNGSAVAAGF